MQTSVDGVKIELTTCRLTPLTTLLLFTSAEMNAFDVGNVHWKYISTESIEMITWQIREPADVGSYNLWERNA